MLCEQHNRIEPFQWIDLDLGIVFGPIIFGIGYCFYCETWTSLIFSKCFWLWAWFGCLWMCLDGFGGISDFGNDNFCSPILTVAILTCGHCLQEKTHSCSCDPRWKGSQISVKWKRHGISREVGSMNLQSVMFTLVQTCLVAKKLRRTKSLMIGNEKHLEKAICSSCGGTMTF